jgi:hypothetical protein
MYFSAANSNKVAMFTTAGAASLTIARCVFVVGSAAAGSTVSCTTEAAALAPGAQLMTFVAGAVTTGNSQPAGIYNVMTTTSSGVTIDTAAAAGGSVPAISGGGTSQPPVAAVSGVSITISSADRNPLQVTTAAVTIAFTTVSVLPLAGKITFTLPANYFTAKATPAGVLVPAAGGTATLTSTCTLTSSALTIVCTTATADLVPGAHKIIFAAGELTTGAATAGSASGLTVSTATDMTSAGAAAPSLGFAP